VGDIELKQQTFGTDYGEQLKKYQEEQKKQRLEKE
jgi:hypothetical protein